ncbi:MAG: NUDIX domain-containing protein [Candidatus Pacearchaeota archaeon]|nr:NUDIX domain-containing protein [Candidatus Pacearchaeota archaeon]
MKYEKSCGAIVFRREGGETKFLLLYRAENENFRASWDFPRGNIEKNETEEQAARREIKEETGITNLKFYKFKDVLHFFYRFQGELVKKQVVYLLAETNDERVTLSEEHQDYKWADFNEALNILTHETSKKTLEKAYKFLKKQKTL